MRNIKGNISILVIITIIIITFIVLFIISLSEDELEKSKDSSMFYKEENTSIKVKDGEFILPAGFKVSEDTGETIDEGIVVEDIERNQFVWIPVDTENFETEFVRIEGYANGKLQEFLTDCGEANRMGINEKIEESIITQNEAKAMYESVEKNKGFYIGRYETGINTNGEAIIKKGAKVYNNVKWSSDEESNSSTSNEDKGAVELARGFSDSNNYLTAKSTLIYGVQWDEVMKYLENIENEDGNLTKYIQDSTKKGWYSSNSNENKELQTGIDFETEKNKVKNIYDLAGNVYEWTMEAYKNDKRIIRGGCYVNTGYGAPASNRYEQEPTYTNNYIGFRIALYLEN